MLALFAGLLLLVALVIWVADLTGSLTLSLCSIGAVMALAAWATYKLTLSPTLKHLRQEYEHTMEIIGLIKRGYECATKRIAQLIDWIV